jgi:glutamine---fructose-6-phosphate transaminase (isomerizing)
MNPFLADLLAQPAALRDAVNRYDTAALAGMRAASFDRIVIAAMGGSHFAGYPAWLTLAQAGLPVWRIEAGELLHHAAALVNKRTLLWLISQSGRSAEILALLDKVVPGQLLALTNDTGSPLAECANAVQQLHAGNEAVVSTKTYVNTLAVSQLIALQMAGKPLGAARESLLKAADDMAAYHARFDAHTTLLGEKVGVPGRLFILGRGASLAASSAAALTLKEAAKLNAEGMSAQQFRHGPYEIADSRVTALILAGDGQARPLNEKLAGDLRGLGVNALMVGSEPGADIPHPAAEDAGLPVVEILPFQLLTFPVAAATGIVAGQFRHSTKVTTVI